MAEVRQGDLVLGVRCPRCGREEVVYNGNYFCDECDWVMPERRSRTNDHIVKTYLIQRRAAAIEKDDTDEVERMEFYLKDYADG
jgi:uncharacterized Zn finger protein (UPF0148 family)